MSNCAESVFFFTWWGEGYTCIILTKEDPQSVLERGGPTEEGGYYESETYTLVQDENDDWIVRSDHYVDCSDCDGRLEQSNESWCYVDELKTKKSRCGCFPTPNWIDGGGSQRDHAAEAMGY